MSDVSATTNAIDTYSEEVDSVLPAIPAASSSAVLVNGSSGCCHPPRDRRSGARPRPYDTDVVCVLCAP